jgi:hypothetical protein
MEDTGHRQVCSRSQSQVLCWITSVSEGMRRGGLHINVVFGDPHIIPFGWKDDLDQGRMWQDVGLC